MVDPFNLLLGRGNLGGNQKMAESRGARPRASGRRSPEALPVLAHELAEKLDCAVLAMRFPVNDRFAIGLAEEIYPRVFGQSQSLPQALSATLLALLAEETSEPFPVLSPAIPAVFGRQALNLDLALRKEARFERHPVARGYAAMPAPPERLVGRVGELIRASRALALEIRCAEFFFTA